MKCLLYLCVIGFLHKYVSAFQCPVDSNQQPINGVYRDPSLCGVYYHCVNGVSLPQQCPPAHHFKVTITECQYFACIPASQSDCSSAEATSLDSHSMLSGILKNKQIAIQAAECQPNLNSTVASSVSPSLYYNCNNGVGWLGQCPPNTVFDPIYDYKKCLNEMCRGTGGPGPEPIDGGWSNWSSWSDCNPTCGEGTRNRTRTCTNPPPSNEGKDCEGESSQTEQCNNGPCPTSGNPAFMVSLNEEKELVIGKLNWTSVNLNSGGLFNKETNSVSVTKPGLYMFSMVFTCSRRKPIGTMLEGAGRNLGLERQAYTSATGPETISRASLHVFTPIFSPYINQRVVTNAYSSENGRETSWLGFHYNSDSYIALASTSTLNRPKVSWPMILHMKGFREKSDLTEFQAFSGGLYFFSMGMKASYSGTSITDATDMNLVISRDNVDKRIYKAMEISIKRLSTSDQFSRSFLMQVDEGDVLITRIGRKSPRSSPYLESYLFAFKLNTAYPYFMASRRKSTCDEFKNIEFPTIKADSMKSWNQTKHHYKVKRAGTYYIESSFEPRTDRTLDVRMYLNNEVVAITKKQNRHDRGYVLTRSILLDLKENDILRWENYGCLGYYLNESTLTIIYVSESNQ